MMNGQNYTLTEIARTMDRNKSTISREIKRNTGGKWVALPSALDSTTKTVTASSSSFSLFGLSGVTPPSDTTAPSVLSAVTAAVDILGDAIVLTFDEEITLSTPKPAATDFTVSGAASNPTVASVSATEAELTLAFALGQTIAGGETITLSYAKTTGSITDGQGNALASCSNQVVNNDPPQKMREQRTGQIA